MPGERPSQRSAKGCWTCRIRHRKCDESLPLCTECSDRHILCHGYGPKPAWVDDPVGLRKELQHIKRNVKTNFCHKRRQTTRGSLHKTDSSPSPKDRERPLPSSKPMTSTDTVPSTFREAQLLVHYLDYIFPRQFPYYVDNPDLGGRGWLFWLLTNKGPLREAALTLSALHKHTGSRDKAENTEEELLRHHTNAMQELRQVLSRHEVDRFADNCEQWIELISCGTALISFEVFQGGIGNWAAHLNALTSLVLQIDPVDLDMYRDGQVGSTGFSSSNGFIPAWRFLICNLLWIDLLACASTGEPSRLPYREWLTSEGLDISCVMGCQNWGMIAIGDLAVLRAQANYLNVEELRSQVEEIAVRLQDGIDSLTSSFNETVKPVSFHVTRVFTTATLVQLHTIMPGEHRFTTDIYNSVAKTIKAIEDVPEGVSLRGLAWPICIAGSMADTDQQPFFQNLMETITGESGFRYSNCGTVLKILQRCWANPNTGSIFEANTIWRGAMSEMGICALLI